jgi:hypothetical protein
MTEYNERGHIIHSNREGCGEFWNDYDYKEGTVTFTSSTGHIQKYYGIPSYRQDGDILRKVNVSK